MPVDSAALCGVLDDLNQASALLTVGDSQFEAGTRRAANQLEALLVASADTPPADLIHDIHWSTLHLRLVQKDSWEEVRTTIARHANAVRSTLGAAACLSASWRLMCAAVQSPGARDPLAAGLPGSDATVEDIHGWWCALDDDEKRDTFARHRSYLGRVDGIPAPVRDDCNRPELDVAITRAAVEIEKIMAVNTRRRVAMRRKLRRERRKRAGLLTIRQRIAELEAAGLEVFLIDLDSEGTGSATIAIGNPDTSDRVVTYLPGGGTSLAKAGGCLDDSTSLLQMIERLDAGLEPLPTTSMVTRIYPVPELAVGVLLPDHAVDEASRFCRFQHGLHVTHSEPSIWPDGEAFYGIVTHSYGGITGLTTDLLFGAEANVMSVNGPPGGVTDHADKLSVPVVYATTKRHDLLTALARPRLIHNRQPVDPKYGARVFASDPGKKWPWPGGRSIAAHFDYFGTDWRSLYGNAQACRDRNPIPVVDTP